ncbi:hypothetical protein D3C78_1913430 [compost metagenome]
MAVFKRPAPLLIRREERIGHYTGARRLEWGAEHYQQQQAQPVHPPAAAHTKQCN